MIPVARLPGQAVSASSGKESDELKLLAIMRPSEGVDVRAEVARHADAAEILELKPFVAIETLFSKAPPS